MAAHSHLPIMMIIGTLLSSHIIIAVAISFPRSGSSRDLGASLMKVYIRHRAVEAYLNTFAR